MCDAVEIQLDRHLADHFDKPTMPTKPTTKSHTAHFHSHLVWLGSGFGCFLLVVTVSPRYWSEARLGFQLNETELKKKLALAGERGKRSCL